MTHRPRPLVRRTLLGTVLTAMTLLALLAPAAASGASGTASSTNPPSSPSSTTVEGYLVKWINRDRMARGLRPYVRWSTLRDVATQRASTLASLGVLSHTRAGSLSSQLSSAGAQYYAWGEDLGYSGYSWGYDVAKSLFTMWRHSPSHWSLMMSSRFNYVGVGLAYRWGNHTTYSSIVFTESRDHTAPSSRMTGASRNGDNVHFSWKGYELKLQTHTAGFRNFDVAYKIDGGAWRTIRSRTTGTSITLYDRPHGHTYYVMVRARDRNGNTSRWSNAYHVSVP